MLAIESGVIECQLTRGVAMQIRRKSSNIPYTKSKRYVFKEDENNNDDNNNEVL